MRQNKDHNERTQHLLIVFILSHSLLWLFRMEMRTSLVLPTSYTQRLGMLICEWVNPSRVLFLLISTRYGRINKGLNGHPIRWGGPGLVSLISPPLSGFHTNPFLKSKIPFVPDQKDWGDVSYWWGDVSYWLRIGIPTNYRPGEIRTIVSRKLFLI